MHSKHAETIKTIEIVFCSILGFIELFVVSILLAEGQIINALLSLAAIALIIFLNMVFTFAISECLENIARTADFTEKILKNITPYKKETKASNTGKNENI